MRDSKDCLIKLLIRVRNYAKFSRSLESDRDSIEKYIVKPSDG